jgi:hypothetical protein
MPDGEDAYEAAIAELHLRYREAVAAAWALQDPFETINTLTYLGDLIRRECIPQAVEERREAARQIHEQEGVTFAELGQRLGMTRQRAHSLVTGSPKYKGCKVAAERAQVLPAPVPALPETELGELVPATALYRLWAADGTLLYIGIADNLKARFDGHKLEKSWWGDVAKATVIWYGSRRDAFQAEDIAIKAERPLYNIVGAVKDTEPLGILRDVRPLPVGVESIRH